MTVKRQQVDINSINAVRAITPDDNLEELAQDLKVNGQLMPLIVDENYNLIDGLRRYHASFIIGQYIVPVVVCPTLEDTCHWLGKTVQNGVLARTLTPLRLYQLFTDTYAQQQSRGARIRAKRAGKPRGTAVGEQRSRAMLNESLGLGPGEAKLAQSAYVYKQFYELQDDPNFGELVKTLRKNLESNAISIYVARGSIDRALKRGVGGLIVDLAEQRNALTTTLNQLSGTSKAVAHIGDIHADMDQAELERYIKGFEQARRTLSGFITSLKKRVTTP